MHEDYPGSGSNPHDIGLVRLSERSDIEPAKLARWPNMPVENAYVTVLGYGAVSDDGPLSEYALQASLRVSNYDQCNSIYGKVIDDLMFCTDSENYEKDSCQGDSGGPLLNNDGIVVGLVFFGAGW